MTDPRPRSERDEKQDKKWYERSLPLFVLTVGGIVLCVLVLALLLDWYINPQTPPEKKGLVQALGLITVGVAGAVGIFFTWRGQRLAREAQENNQENTQEQLRLSRQSQEQNQKSTQAQLENSQEELRLTREGQITERFTRAIEQLGNDSSDVRIGGIYALATIASDSDAYYWPAIEILSAYIRQHSPWPPQGGYECGGVSPAEEELTHRHRLPDIQAILYILKELAELKEGKRSYGDGGRKFISLTNTDLRNADLRGARLVWARLRGANLKGARLYGAHLRIARLRNAIFEEAKLRGAELQRADLEQAVLCKADFRRANLAGADLERADFRGANLAGANLERARHLTRDQIELAIGNNQTILPENLTNHRPSTWSKSLDEQRRIVDERIRQTPKDE
jgi:Pentapeptide repeats (8 copies)